MNNEALTKKIESLESKLQTQYKPRIKSLWGGLQGIDKATKSMQNRIGAVAAEEEKSGSTITIMERMERLEMNMREMMKDRLEGSNEESHQMKAVRRWLGTDVNLPQYLDMFIENGFDDLTVIQALTINDLLEMGIEKKGHRIKIVRAIAKLKVSSVTPRN